MSRTSFSKRLQNPNLSTGESAGRGAGFKHSAWQSRVLKKLYRLNWTQSVIIYTDIYIYIYIFIGKAQRFLAIICAVFSL